MSALKKLYNTASFDISEVNKIAQNNYPHLCKLLAQRYTHNGTTVTRRQRLQQFLDAVRQFKTDTPEDYTDREGRLWIPVPRGSKLIADNHGGPGSWGNNIRAFCVLGLAYPYNPDRHGKKNAPQVQHFRAAYEARRKTEDMRQYYREHPEEKKSAKNSPTFYLIPRYSKKRLAEADRRAAILEGFSVGKWGMDAIRDALGNEAANCAFDVKYTQHGPATAEQRERLKMAALKRLYDDGYFYPADVLADVLSASDAIQAAEAARAEAGDIFDAYDEPLDLETYSEKKQRERHFTQTWEQYLTPFALLREMRWTLCQPNDEERQRYNITGNTRIVTRRR